ncbi:MAG: GHKL domain-containing protein [Saprospiraceae bacterium]|nr:GHKL domain-containing protein [Saprospiraceae bacterium]
MLIVAGYTHYSFYQRDSIDIARTKFENYLSKAESEINDIVNDPAFLQSIINLYSDDVIENRNIDRASDLVKKNYTIFFYNQSNRLVSWTNDKAPSPDLSAYKFGSSYYLKSQNIYYTLHFTRQIGGSTYKILACIPVRLGNADEPYSHIDKNLSSTLQLTTTPGIPIITANGEDFLYIANVDFEKLTKKEVRILLFLYFLAFLSLAVLIHRIAYLVKDKIGIWPAVGFFLFTTIGIRLVSYLFDFTDQFSVLKLFSPSVTAPAFSNSLGNILINVILLLWISVFLINNLDLRKLNHLKPLQKTVASFVGYFLICLGMIGLAKFCEALIQNTNIDFNFESVFNLDSISILALIGIILTLFSFFVWSAKIISVIQDFRLLIKPKLFAGISAVLLALPLALKINPTIPFFQFALVVSIFILLLDIFLEVKTPNFTWIVLWLVVLSGFSSILMFKYNRDKDIYQRTDIAKALTESVDTVALDQMIALIEEMSETIDHVETWEDARNVINSTYDNFSASYLNTHYDLSFPRAGELKDSREIKYNNQHFYQRNDALDHYLLTIDGAQGIKVLTSIQKKKSNPYNPLPDFLPKPNFKNIPELSDYEYAIYKDRRCLERSLSEYKMILDGDIPPIGDTKMIYPPDRSELIYNNGTYVTLIGRKLTGLIKPVSLFSYLFVIIVLIIFILLILNSAFPYLPEDFNFTLSNQISLRNKIQVSVLTLIVLSFIIIGIVTVVYFRSTAEKNYEDKLTQTASSLQYEIHSRMQQDTIPGFDSIFSQSIQSLAIKYNTHIQLFDKIGLLTFSSDSTAVEAGVLKDRMDIPPLLAIKRGGESIYIYENKSDPLTDYNTAFFSLISDDEEFLGFAGLPYYPGLTEAANSVKDFMGTLLNVYVFLLLIAGAFALAVANSITRPMTVLGQKLKDFKLGKSNEPIEWKAKDELGLLIQEYNQMIVKLDESADLLALTEREVAWREMAKQVAHEIKNPLTPMRLSIQHLQHAMQNADPIESRQLVQRVGMTLIEQIDNLSRIAAEFSTFAKMPKPQYEKIILNDLVASVHDLFKKRDDMDFNLYVPIDEIYVNADKSHLLRVLNNLIKNAIQAIPGSRRGVIDIRLEKQGDRAIIQVSDNGKGISREMKEKVFYPNFTTKTSGTGLGLAISKNIVESFGGRIYFETEEGVGTKFYFELPLLKNFDNDYPYRQALEL